MKRDNFSAVCAMLCAAVALGANASETESGDSAVINLQAVEITANRADRHTPVAYSNLDAGAIGKVNDGRDLPYIIQFTPSVVTTSDAGAGIGYTGMRIRGSDSSRINVMANGVPINNPESHNVYWVNMPDLASSLRDVQVQRGVGTSANGAGAFGASINMQTQFPSETPFGELSGGYGSYNSYKATLRTGTGLIGNHWSADIRISTLGSDGYIERAKTRLWSYFGQVGYINGGTSLRLMAFGGKEKTYMAWDYASKEQMSEFGRRYNPCGEYIDDKGEVAYYPNQNDNYIQHHLQLHLTQLLPRGWKLNAALHYTNDDGYYEQYKKNRTLAEYGLEPFVVDGVKVKKSDLVRYKHNDNDFGGALVNALYSSDRLELNLGVAGNYFKGRHFGRVGWVRNYVGDINPLQEYYRNTGEKSEESVYARGGYSFGAGFTAFADLQYRHIDYSIRGANDTYDYNTGAMQQLDIRRRYDFFNPKVGINWEINRQQRAYASWSVAHREPVRDNFTDCAPGRWPKAERLFDYELGYSFENRHVTAAASLYFMDYKDQLVPTGQLSDTGNPVSVNVPRSYRLGVEIEGAWRPVRWFDWSLTATFSRNRILNFTEYIYEDEWTNPITIDCGETPIAFSPDIVLGNAFNFRWRGFEASLMSRFVSKQYLTNARNEEQTLDPYFVSDLRLGYTLRSIAGLKELTLGVTIYNIFNERYESNGYAGSGYYLQDGEKVIYRYAGYAAQAPTNVMATVAVKF